MIMSNRRDNNIDIDVGKRWKQKILDYVNKEQKTAFRNPHAHFELS